MKIKPPKVKPSTYKRKEYGVVGKLNGHTVWWSARYLPPDEDDKLWRRGCGWAVIVGSKKAADKLMRRAEQHSGKVKALHIVEITTISKEKIKLLKQ